MQCVRINGSGQVVQDNLSQAPNCAELMVLTPVDYYSMTYWAQLAQYLEPGQPPFNALVGTMILAYASIYAGKMALGAIKRANRES